MVSPPFRSPTGARVYLLFAYGRIVVFIVGPLGLIAALLVPSRRPLFGAIFLAMFTAMLAASLVAVLVGAVHGSAGRISERMSSPFTLRFVDEAAEILGRDADAARTQARAGITASVVVITIGVAIVAMVSG